jgi:hypothetical protein
VPVPSVHHRRESTRQRPEPFGLHHRVLFDCEVSGLLISNWLISAWPDLDRPQNRRRIGRIVFVSSFRHDIERLRKTEAASRA